MEKTEWKPDFGPEHIHPTAGVSAVGARMPLVAFNINLDTNNLDIATAIAKRFATSTADSASSKPWALRWKNGISCR